MDNSRKNAIKLLIQGFKCNLNDSFDENSIIKICTSSEEYIYNLCKKENQKKYRSDINNFVIILKNNNIYDIKIEYLKGLINEEEFINKIYNTKNNSGVKKRQLSKENRNKIYSPNALHLVKERKASSQNKEMNKEIVNDLFEKREKEIKNNESINKNKYIIIYLKNYI